jgi:hypothetical protein
MPRRWLGSCQRHQLPREPHPFHIPKVRSVCSAGVGSGTLGGMSGEVIAHAVTGDGREIVIDEHGWSYVLGVPVVFAEKSTDMERGSALFAPLA